MAAVLEDALLEERQELADGVFSEMETAVCVGSERRAGGRQHHPEQVPQITLQRKQQHEATRFIFSGTQRDERLICLRVNQTGLRCFTSK